MSCTEKVIIGPVFTNNTDWVPILTLEHNNYHRIKLNTGEIPLLEVERNLLYRYVQYRKQGQPLFMNFDSSELTYQGWFKTTYISDPFFIEDTDYEVRMVIEYRNGEEKVSNTVQFTNPIVLGEVIDSILVPVEFWPPCTGCDLPGLTFTDSSIYVISQDYDILYRIDRNTRISTLLLSDFRPNHSRYFYRYRDLLVIDNYIYLSVNTDYDEQNLEIKKFNLNTLEIDDSLKIRVPQGYERNYGRIFYLDETTLGVLWNLDSLMQIEIANSVSGEIINSYPVFDMIIDPYYDRIIYDGTNYWIAFYKEFDNRIVKFDPSLGTISNIHRNPVYQSSNLAWDGENFWVHDKESYSIVKLELEGL